MLVKLLCRQTFLSSKKPESTASNRTNIHTMSHELVQRFLRAAEERRPGDGSQDVPPDEDPRASSFKSFEKCVEVFFQWQETESS